MKLTTNLRGSNTRATKKTMSSMCSLTQRKPTKVSTSFCFAKADGQICVSGVLVDQHTPMGEVFIFLNTATYDEFERDVKVNVTA